MKLFNYKDTTYTLQKLELKDTKPGQRVVTFMSRGEELTYDVHCCKVVSVDYQTGDVSYTGEEVLDSFAAYDYKLSSVEAKHLEVDILDKYSDNNGSMDFLVIGAVKWK